jgi:aminopeptidase N
MARNHLPLAFGEELLSQFYQEFNHQALVVDAWFRLQAACPRDNTLEQVLSLENHQAFDVFNPNKIRALYFAFASLNPRNLHSSAGEGYQFVAQRVKKLDSSNPQMAARLATILTQWSRFDAKRQIAMKQSLRWLANSDGLSKDVFEVVNKGLE